MRLIYVKMSGYKHLKDASVRFHPQTENRLFRGDIPIRFLIGLNGSGKSVFLEGLCVLFSRLVQDEVPGFDFCLLYEIKRGGKVHLVQVSNGTQGGKFEIRVSTDGQEEPSPLYSFAQRRELLPDYVFTCASGNNNNFFDVMVKSPRDALYSGLYDVSLLGKTTLDMPRRNEKVRELLDSLRRLEENPLCLFVDEQTATLALGAFLAVFPRCEDPQERGARIACRRKILHMLDSCPEPVSFSLILHEKQLAALKDSADEYGELFSALYAEDTSVQRICDWDTSRMYQDEVPDAEDVHGDRVLTFLFDSYFNQEGDAPYVSSLTQAYGDPIKLLSKLILARNKGLIKEAHISFRIRGTEDILEENALSEGEFMLLVRLGLLAMGRGGGENCQCLYLFDEPDVYLNERWNIDFVSMIHQIYEGSDPLHEIVVATHSSLILTDALPDQLYYFRSKDGNARCYNIQASTFGGSRNEIMEALFQTKRSVGSFAYSKIEALLESAQSADELESFLEIVGSGYLRLRLLDKIQYLREQEE